MRSLHLPLPELDGDACFVQEAPPWPAARMGRTRLPRRPAASGALCCAVSRQEQGGGAIRALLNLQLHDKASSGIFFLALQSCRRRLAISSRLYSRPSCASQRCDAKKAGREVGRSDMTFLRPPSLELPCGPACDLQQSSASVHSPLWPRLSSASLVDRRHHDPAPQLYLSLVPLPSTPPPRRSLAESALAASCTLPPSSCFFSSLHLILWALSFTLPRMPSCPLSCNPSLAARVRSALWPPSFMYVQLDHRSPAPREICACAISIRLT